MPAAKLVSLQEAIANNIPNSSTVALGLAQETLIPFAAGHEIIRQQIRDLTVIGPISDILFDQMIGAGCVSKVRASWVGNVITGSGYNFRRAIESGALDIEDHSILTLTTALIAGKMGIPFMPTLTALGSDINQTNDHLKTLLCPFTRQKLTAVKAICPDVAIIHTQRADKFGNAHFWGNMGITREAALASRSVIITSEDIVAPDIIKSDPNRVILPGFKVAAVVHLPWGAHPSPAPGYYNRDHQMFLEYRDASRRSDSFNNWRRNWIDSVRTPEDYLKKIGKDRLGKLRLTQHSLSEPVDYGY
jgi:glutaconate CoA-transferase subunit A